MAEPANIPTPPAWDFTSEGLRIWVNGKPETTLPRHAFGNLTLDLVRQMKDAQNAE